MANWYEYMTALGNKWSKEYDAVSKKEGWALFNADGIMQIQRVDEPEDGDPLLSNDGEAYAIVAQKALEGSKLHILALYLDGQIAKDDDIYVPKLLVEK